MAGQVRLDHYDKLTKFADSETISADFTSSVVDIRKYRRGLVYVNWTGYDGTSGKVRLQIAPSVDTPDSEWNDWGGLLGARSLDAAADSQVFHIWDVPPVYMRLQFLLGDGTTATLSAEQRMGS